MKKYIALLLSVLVIVACFVGCSANADKNADNKEASSTTERSTISPEVTAEAKIKDAEAINFIEKAYTKEELGLEDVKEEYSFMVSHNPEEIDGQKYIKVAANVMAQNEVTGEGDKPTYSLTPVGEYYISFDGKKVKSKDLKTGEYKELENKYDSFKADSDKSEKE